MAHANRLLAGVLSTLLLLASVGCGRVSAPDEEPVTHLTFGAPPIRAKDQMAELFAPTLAYISSKARAEITLRIMDDYSSLITAMDRGEVDMGWFSPVPYVQAAKTGETEPLVEAKVDGAYAYTGLIIARKASGLQALGQLRGKSFAFVDRGSSSGYVYPVGMLLEQGINPASFFGQVSFAGGHDKVVLGVLDGTYDAGAVSDNVLPELERTRGVKVDDLVVLGQTTAIPQSVIAVGSGLDARLKARLRYVMTEMGYTVQGKAILAASSLGLQGFAPIGAQDFEPTLKVVALADTIRIDPSKP